MEILFCVIVVRALMEWSDTSMGRAFLFGFSRQEFSFACGVRGEEECIACVCLICILPFLLYELCAMAIRDRFSAVEKR
jgi:hypothetical protein